MIGEIIAVCAVLLIVIFAIAYIVRAKKRGAKCIGCPHAKSCGGGCGRRKK